MELTHLIDNIDILVISALLETKKLKTSKTVIFIKNYLLEYSVFSSKSDIFYKIMNIPCFTKNRVFSIKDTGIFRL